MIDLSVALPSSIPTSSTALKRFAVLWYNGSGRLPRTGQGDSPGYVLCNERNRVGRRGGLYALMPSYVSPQRQSR
jgi:hypothetical protein